MLANRVINYNLKQLIAVAITLAFERFNLCSQRFFTYILISFAFATSCVAAPAKIDAPRANSESIYFNCINSLSKKVDWEPLRQVKMPEDSIEIRVWIGFGRSALRGILIRRDGNQWCGFKAIDGLAGKQPFQLFEVTPKSGWDSLWKRLEALGILTLPDSSTLPNAETVADGTSYVVEINDGKHYRTYEYDNPKYQIWPEAKKIIEIEMVLSSELIKKDL